MTRLIRNVFLTSGAAFLVAVLLAMSLLRLSGIEHVYFDHVIATLEFSGLQTAAEATDLDGRFQEFPGLRELTIAQNPCATDVWIARLQFHATNPAAAAQQLGLWLRSLPSSPASRLVKATFYDYRLSRPARGDIVLGKARPLPALQGE